MSYYSFGEKTETALSKPSMNVAHLRRTIEDCVTLCSFCLLRRDDFGKELLCSPHFPLSAECDWTSCQSPVLCRRELAKSVFEVSQLPPEQTSIIASSEWHHKSKGSLSFQTGTQRDLPLCLFAPSPKKIRKCSWRRFVCL